MKARRKDAHEDADEEEDTSASDDDEGEDGDGNDDDDDKASSSSDFEHDTTPTTNQGQAAKQTKSEARQHAALLKRLRKAVHRQAKTAKKYEIRKAIRDVKGAREKRKNADGKLEARMEARLEILKGLDVDGLVKLSLGESAVPKQESDMFKAMVEKVLAFKGLQSAATEFAERPKREEDRRQRERAKLEALEKKERKKLERATFQLTCGVGTCMAKFATEEARQTHRIKRHGSTGDANLDKTLGLRSSNRPGQRERRKIALLKQEEEGKASHGGDSEAPSPSAEEEEAQEPPKPRGTNPPATRKRPDDTRPAAVKRTRVEEEVVLHPSWEAKRKLAEKKAAPFQGNKVEFSDEE